MPGSQTADQGAPVSQSTRRFGRCQLIPTICGQLCAQPLNRCAKSRNFKPSGCRAAFLSKRYPLRINDLPQSHGFRREDEGSCGASPALCTSAAVWNRFGASCLATRRYGCRGGSRADSVFSICSRRIFRSCRVSTRGATAAEASGLKNRGGCRAASACVVCAADCCMPIGRAPSRCSSPAAGAASTPWAPTASTNARAIIRQGWARIARETTISVSKVFR